MADLPNDLHELQELLRAERHKTATLLAQITELKHSQEHLQLEAEAEEERVVNKLMMKLESLSKDKQHLVDKVTKEEAELEKAHVQLAQSSQRLEELKHEKQSILMQVEQEEEFLVNTLQKKLKQLKKEKVDLENQLEHEQEYISNKLQKKIDAALADKRLLESKLEEEHALLAQKESEKQALRKQLQDLQNHIEEQQENITNKLQKQIAETNSEKKQLEERSRILLKEREVENEQLQKDLLRLQSENFVLTQRIRRESDRLREMSREKTKMFQNWEMMVERTTLEGFRRDIGWGGNLPRRTSRSKSLPTTPDPHTMMLLSPGPGTPLRLCTPDRSQSPTPLRLKPRVDEEGPFTSKTP